MYLHSSPKPTPNPKQYSKYMFIIINQYLNNIITQCNPLF